MNTHDFDSTVQSRMDIWLRELARICAFPSVSAHKRSLPETADWICSRLEQSGFVTRQFSEGGSPPVIWAEAGEGPRTLLFYNHYDVQPAEPLELWDTDPFVMTERDGLLFTRGIADNKGDFLSRLHAIDTWKETQGELPLKIRFLLEGEEEIGSPHLEEILKKHGQNWAADGCIWEGAGRDEHDRPEIYCGAKGMLYVELYVRTLERDLHSMYGGMVPNAAARLMQAVSCLRDNEGRVTIDGMNEMIRPLNSAEQEALKTIPFDSDSLAQSIGTKHLAGNRSDMDALKHFINGATANIAGMWSGYTGEGAKTIVPAEATVKMDFRLVPDLTVDAAHRLLREHLNRNGFNDVEISVISGQNPGRTPVNDPIVDAAAAVWTDLGVSSPAVFPNMPGTGPISLVIDGLSIPTIMAGGVGWPGDRIHSPNESIRKEDYLTAVRYWGRFMEQFSRTPG